MNNYNFSSRIYSTQLNFPVEREARGHMKVFWGKKWKNDFLVDWNLLKWIPLELPSTFRFQLMSIFRIAFFFFARTNWILCASVKSSIWSNTVSRNLRIPPISLQLFEKIENLRWNVFFSIVFSLRRTIYFIFLYFSAKDILEIYKLEIYEWKDLNCLLFVLCESGRGENWLLNALNWNE